MGDKILQRIMISIAVLLTMTVLPMGHLVGADEVDIDFPDISGTITSDQTWSGTQTFGYVTIQAGVNVTVSPGAVLNNHYTDSWIIAEGNLIAIGDEESPIRFGVQGSTWDTIRAIEGGSIHMENCSVWSGTFNIQLSGAPSYLKNVTAIGGTQGFKINSEGNQLIDCTALDSANYGFLMMAVYNGLNLIDPHVEGCKYGVYMSQCYYVNITGAAIIDSTTYSIYGTSARYTHVDDCAIDDGGSYAVLLTGESHGSLVENSRLNGTLGGIYIGSNDITVRNCDITFSEDDEADWGIILSHTIENLLIEDCVVNNCKWGISYTTNKWSDVTVTGTSFGPNVKSVMVPGSLTKNGYDEEINITFEHCSLYGNESIIKGLKADSHVWLKNTTFTSGPMDLFNLSGGEVFLSWLVDFRAIDGNGDLTPFNLNIQLENGDDAIDIDVHDGFLEDLELPYGYFNDTVGYEYQHEVRITSLVDDRVIWTDGSFGPNSRDYYFIEWNLPITNSLPDPITLDEDEMVTWNLSEYFDDPEGQPIEYEILGGPDIYFDLNGSLLTFGGVEDFNGETWIDISASDAGDNTSFENVSITVLSINDAPRLTMDLPELVIEEDSTGWINLSGYGEDEEGDTFFWNSSAVQHAALSWDLERINLTIIPETDWNGILEIELNLSDGVDWINPILTVNVTPMNDAPTGTIVWSNGTDVGYSVEDVDGVNVTVISVELLEDTSISFSIAGSDVDGDDLLYLPEYIGVDLGTLNVETYTYLNETNVSVTGTVPNNFTYVPDPDMSGEDIVLFLIHDGMVNDTIYVKFDIIPVNDEPILDMTDPLTVNVDIGVPQTVNISEYVSDVDGMETLTLTISDSEYAMVDGLSILLDYPDTYTGSGETLTVTISDGEYTVTGEIVVAVNGDPIGEWEVTDVKVKASEDGWTVTAQGDEGQEVFLVVEDEDGNKESFPMTWDGEQYTAIIEEDDAEEGMEWYVTDSEDGENPNPGMASSLPKLGETNDPSGSLTLVIIVLLLIALALIIAIVAVARKSRGEEDLEE